MPPRRSRRAGGARRVRRRGGAIDWRGLLNKANDFFKKSKIVSTVGSALGSAGVPYASAIGKFASSHGYGRRRTRRRR